MKPEQFEGNDTYMRYEYHRVREGPNYFVTYYKHSSRLIYDPKDAWKTLGIAKFTDTGKALKEWCLLMNEQYGAAGGTYGVPDVADGAESVARSGRADTSFASDADTEALEEVSPTDNTKMIT